MAFRCLFHVHTRRSFDSLLSPARVLARARQANVDVLIVTDHNTLAGAQEVRALARSNPKFVVMAAEYQTEKGDLIGLFLKEEIRTRLSEEVIEQVHAQGGLVVLPHPYRGHRLDDALLAGTDLIEIHNSRCSAGENASAAALAAKLGRPSLGGPDAHCTAELGAVLNHFSAPVPENESALRESLLCAPRRMEARAISRVFGPYSQMIKAVKTRNPRLFVGQMKHFAVTLVEECLP
jgi:predicted metal-dependent phosphoesterase TrpH